MKNKLLINQIKNAAELAMASYGYYDLIGKKITNDREKSGDKADKPITLHDILDSTYNNYIATEQDISGKDIEIGILKGDMTPTQAKRFFDKCDILIHQPNTESGFSATLFQNKESKEYTLAFRGTESHHNFKYNRVAS